MDWLQMGADMLVKEAEKVGIGILIKTTREFLKTVYFYEMIKRLIF